MSVWQSLNFTPHPAAEPRTDAALPRQGAPLQPRSWRRLLFLAAAALALFTAGFWTWSQFVRPVEVRVAHPQANVHEQIFGLGKVGARVVSNVGFKVAGVLTDLSADQGDLVRKGTVLARLDAHEVEAQLAVAKAGVSQAQATIGKAQADRESAEASLTNARAVSARRADLARSGYASKEEAQNTEALMRVARANLDVAASGVTLAQAGLEEATAQVAYTQATLDNYSLRAPYDALVVSRNLQLGSMPVPGQPVYNLVEPQTIWILSYVDERLAGPLRIGQQAQIVLRSRPEERLPGHIARIEIQSDPVNEERLVEVAFDAIPPDIHLAEQAEVFITTGILANAVLVPQAAVTGLADGHGTVWTVEQGQLARRSVSFGPQLIDGTLPITAGLPAGAEVVLAPRSGLRVGRAATVVEGGGP